MLKIVKYDPEKDSLQELQPVVIKCYLSNKRFFGTDLENLKIALFYNRSEMDNFCGTKTQSWLVGRSSNTGIIGIFGPSVFDKVSPHPKTDFAPTLTHEIAHLFVMNIFPFRYPAWLFEGIPGYIAKQYKTYPLSKKSIQDFKKLHSKEDWDKNRNYPQAWSFTQYLIKRFGKKRLIKFLFLLERNDSFPIFSKKFEKILKTKFSEAVKEWLSSF
jgi:hypothetical protein